MSRNCKIKLRRLIIVIVVCLFINLSAFSQEKLTDEKLNRFLTATVTGDTETIKACFSSGLDPNLKHDGVSYLVLAVINSANPTSIQAFVEAGVDVNTSEDKTTALMFATINKNKHQLKNMKTLLQAGADVNKQDKYGFTALMRTILTNFPDTEDRIKLLLSYDADINLTNNDGKTALDLAKERNKWQFVELLHSFAINK